MEGMMQVIMQLMAVLLGVYSMLIFIRIILGWFGSTRNSAAMNSAPVRFLAAVTDPYLAWFARNLRLRVGILDLSPIVAIAVLSVFQTLCGEMARRGRVSLGIILAVSLSALWSAVSFVLGFCFIVLVLRLIAYFSGSNVYSPFWQVIESISRPVLYRINRIIFGKRIVRYTTGLITAIVVLAALWFGGRMGVNLLFGFLVR